MRGSSASRTSRTASSTSRGSTRRHDLDPARRPPARRSSSSPATPASRSAAARLPAAGPPRHRVRAVDEQIIALPPPAARCAAGRRPREAVHGERVYATTLDRQHRRRLPRLQLRRRSAAIAMTADSITDAAVEFVLVGAAAANVVVNGAGAKVGDEPLPLPLQLHRALFADGRRPAQHRRGPVPRRLVPRRARRPNKGETEFFYVFFADARRRHRRRRDGRRLRRCRRRSC